MNKAHENINWLDYPLVDTPITAANLNKMDRSVDTIDDRVVAMDTSKANAEDVLLTIDAQMSLTTGVITFTRKNGTTFTINTNLNRLATNLRYDSDPTSEHYQQLILTYNTDPVSYGYVDLTALITQYEFTDSASIHFAVTNGNISATLIDGSITAEKLQPNFLADCNVAKAQAESAATGSNASALVAEGFSSGTQNGIPVTSESRYYHNNAEWFKNQASQIAAGTLAGLNDVTIDNPTQHQTILYDEQTQEWFNSDISSGLLPKLHIVTESNSSVTVTKGAETFTPTLIEAGVYEMDVPEYGTYTVRAINSIGTQTVNVVVDTCKIYNVTAYHFNATITVTYPAGAVCTITKDGVSRTADTNPMAFGVNEVGTYTIAIAEDGQTVSQNVTITTDGQTETLTLDFAYITVTIPAAYVGSTVVIDDGTSTRSWVSDSTAHTFVCILGEYTLSMSGFSTTVTVSEYTTYTATIETLDPSTATPNVLEYWLYFGEVEGTYSTLADVLADSTALSALMASTNAVIYLARCDDWISDITGNQSAMSYIGLNNYCANTLLSDSAWCLAIVQSSYKELVLNVKVPVMTSDTTPSGQVIYSSYYDTRYYAWQTFNGNLNSNGWVPSSSASFNDAYVGYIFVDPVSVKAIMLYTYVIGAYHVSNTYKLQGSNDGINWTDLSDNLVVTDYMTVCNFAINNANTYSQYRLRYLAASSGDITNGNGLHAQFYGREDV